MAQLDRIVMSPAVSIESLRLRRTGAQGVYINNMDGGFVTGLPQNLIPRFKVFLISFYIFFICVEQKLSSFLFFFT